MSTTANASAVNTAPLSIGDIAQRIHLIRGQRVVLDTDLAAFYGETTKRSIGFVTQEDKPKGTTRAGRNKNGT